MAAAREGPPIDQTAGWRTALLFGIFFAIAWAWEAGTARLDRWLRARGKRALRHVVRRLEFELLVLGLISLVLAVFQEALLSICVSGDSWGEEYAAANSCGDGRAPLWSSAAIVQAHILLFTIAAVHIAYAACSLLLCVAKIERWRPLEERALKAAAVPASAPAPRLAPRRPARRRSRLWAAFRDAASIFQDAGAEYIYVVDAAEEEFSRLLSVELVFWLLLMARVLLPPASKFLLWSGGLAALAVAAVAVKLRRVVAALSCQAACLGRGGGQARAGGAAGTAGLAAGKRPEGRGGAAEPGGERIPASWGAGERGTGAGAGRQAPQRLELAQMEQEQEQADAEEEGEEQQLGQEQADAEEDDDGSEEAGGPHVALSIDPSASESSAGQPPARERRAQVPLGPSRQAAAPAAPAPHASSGSGAGGGGSGALWRAWRACRGWLGRRAGALSWHQTRLEATRGGAGGRGPGQELFWLGRPRLLLRAIQIVYFENSTAVAIVLFSLWQRLTFDFSSVGGWAALAPLLLVELLLLLLTSLRVLPTFALAAAAAHTPEAVLARAAKHHIRPHHVAQLRRLSAPGAPTRDRGGEAAAGEAGGQPHAAGRQLGGALSPEGRLSGGRPLLSAVVGGLGDSRPASRSAHAAGEAGGAAGGGTAAGPPPAPPSTLARRSAPALAALPGRAVAPEHAGGDLQAQPGDLLAPVTEHEEAQRSLTRLVGAMLQQRLSAVPDAQRRQPAEATGEQPSAREQPLHPPPPPRHAAEEQQQPRPRPQAE
eukprot:scaffold19.g1858.t1